MLPALLSEAADPDSAILFFDRLVSESGQEILSIFERHNILSHYAIVVFGRSRYLGETLLRNPDLLSTFLHDQSLEHSFSREAFQQALEGFRSRSLEYDSSRLLARFKRRQYVHIMLRDVLKVASLAETTAEISTLSDVLIEDALRVAEVELRARLAPGQPVDDDRRTPFAVLALGKLGGNELNYNSDIDLLYLYGDGEPSPATSLSPHEYYIRLAQEVTGILSRVTAEGQVFRIDLRLRPQGTEGELALSLRHCLRYYSEVAQDWERQALIKARYCAGDRSLARDFLRGIETYVYGQEVNFAAIKTALLAREKMQARRRLLVAGQGRTKVRTAVDVKLDPGGIRDIEFLVQCLQRVYGGGEPWLRSGGTLFALHKLHDKRHLSGKEFHDLTSSYEFLRRVEHALQLRQGQQTHCLPEHGHELTVLRRALGDFSAAGERIGDIVTAIRSRMAEVTNIYNRLVYQQQAGKENTATEVDFRLLAAADLGVPAASDRFTLQRLAMDAPRIYQLAHRDDLHPETRKKLFRFLSAAFSTSEQYGVLLRNAEGLERAIRLFEASDYLTDLLVRHPDEIRMLTGLHRDPSKMASARLFDEASGQLSFAGDPVLAYLGVSDSPYEEKLSYLRQHYRQREFVCLARDLLESRQVYESLGAMTAAAEDAIAAAFTMAGAPAGLCVLALGRLATREFDIFSDADLVFVADETADRARLTKAAELLMHALAAYTQDGMLFPIDPRLRPRGSEGELVVSAKQLEAYFAREAQAWEALTYTKLRPIAGDSRLGQEAISAAATLFRRFARHSAFRSFIQEMRSKLENADGQNFKSAPGAAYDIDFLAGYLLITHEVRDKNGTMRDRLWRCAAAGHLGQADAARLDHAAEFLRTVEHVVRLVTGRSRRWLPERPRALERTERLTSAILGRTFPRGIAAELENTLRQVREVYARVVG
ncbi:MAG: hypothetical protein JO266_17550 [Acidobacteria bacterium]|nr:hypothetical protein [Acidobacteriota bacterium]